MAVSVHHAAKLFVKRMLRSLIYRFPPIMIWPNRLYVWLDVLSRTNDLEGEVLEVGCYLGGTAAVSVKMLDAIGSNRAYTVVDTFNGFDPNQFNSEVELGASVRLAREFSTNSPALTRWVLNKHGARRANIIVGDISFIDDNQLPSQISACLLDVDLAAPIYEGLKKIYPRMVVGGIIAVDDCSNIEGGYKAQIGYEKFLREIGKSPEYKYGMGLITKVVNATS